MSAASCPRRCVAAGAALGGRRRGFAESAKKSQGFLKVQLRASVWARALARLPGRAAGHLWQQALWGAAWLCGYRALALCCSCCASASADASPSARLRRRRRLELRLPLRLRLRLQLRLLLCAAPAAAPAAAAVPKAEAAAAVAALAAAANKLTIDNWRRDCGVLPSQMRGDRAAHDCCGLACAERAIW